MAYQNAFSNTFAPAAHGGFIAALTNRAHLFLKRHKAYTTTFNELSACTDRDLNDLGIARSDIRRLALEAADAVQ